MLQWSKSTASGCTKISLQRMSLSYWKILKTALRKKDLKMEEIKLKDLKEEPPLKTRSLWKANKDTLVISLRLSKIGFIKKNKKKLKPKRRKPLPLLPLLRNEQNRDTYLTHSPKQIKKLLELIVRIKITFSLSLISMFVVKIITIWQLFHIGFFLLISFNSKKSSSLNLEALSIALGVVVVCREIKSKNR